MATQSKHTASIVFAFVISFSFIIIALTRRAGGEMLLIFGIAILLFAVTSLTVWGIRQFRRNRKA